MRPAVFPPTPLACHALVDSGEGEKLERFGERLLRRPDPQALWRRRLDPRRWEEGLAFVRESDRGGRWEPAGERPGGAPGTPEWEVEVQPGVRAVLRATPFKHVGLFPEQAVHWAWIAAEGRRRCAAGGEPPRLLNLFGYTGVASLVAARAGFRVTHVDASRTSIAWARENAERSGIDRSAVRFLVEDATAFVRRETRRGARYEALVLDPPHYGRGPRGEKWQFEAGIAPLLEACAALSAERSIGLLSTYAIGTSPTALEVLVADLVAPEGIEAGELVLEEEPAGSGAPRRRLPCGFSARWRRGGTR